MGGRYRNYGDVKCKDRIHRSGQGIKNLLRSEVDLNLDYIMRIGFHQALTALLKVFLYGLCLDPFCTSDASLS